MPVEEENRLSFETHRRRPRSRRRRLRVFALIVSLCGTAALPASAAADCPSGNQTYNGSCGPPFTLPYWGDSAGWTDASQYSTIQLADVLGKGRDQLIGRSSAGIEIWDFDTTLGQWRPAMDANGNQMILTEFGDPPPLTTANPTPPDTDWTKPQYYSTIQTGDVLGTGRPQIVGRSATGVIVYSYTPGANGAPGLGRKPRTPGRSSTRQTSLPAGTRRSGPPICSAGGRRSCGASTRRSTSG
jgi:hypothetical protein